MIGLARWLLVVLVVGRHTGRSAWLLVVVASGVRRNGRRGGCCGGHRSRSKGIAGVGGDIWANFLRALRRRAKIK